MKNKILVTGVTGFLGSHLNQVLQQKYPDDEIFGVSSKDYDLLDQVEVKKMFAEICPNIVVHLAAYSGGIGANRTYPADFFYQNILLMSLVFEQAAKSNVDRLIYTIGGCSYPAIAESPIKEESMWDGYAQEESAGYSMAKKMGIVASKSYYAQYKLNSIVLIPGNMYGEFDNFRENESHVIPGMIRRFYEANERGDKEIQMWGTGSPKRDFVYAGDVAKIIPHFIDNFDIRGTFNISTGTTTSIKELAETIKRLMGYNGKLCWDLSKPDGQMIKIFDVDKINKLGLFCDTDIKTGLEKTINWYIEMYENDRSSIRI